MNCSIQCQIPTCKFGINYEKYIICSCGNKYYYK